MSQSVAQKTSISEKTWRRQTDSPSWWIAFSCGSVILHLLAFWSIGSYKLSSSQQRRSQSAVPIEFIEISPQKSSPVQPKPKPKPVTPKPAKPIVPQNSQPAIPRTVKPPVTTSDRNAIAFDNQKIEQQQQQELAQRQQQQLAQRQQQELAQRQQQELAQRQQQELAQRQQQELAQRQQQELAQRQQQELAQRQQQELAQRQQQELAQRQQQELAQRQQQEAEQQIENPADGEKIADAPTDARGLTPPEQLAKAPQAPIQNQLNQSGGILTGSWKIEADTPFQDKPDNLAKPQKRSNSDIPLPPPQDGNFQPGDFLVWLTIDNQGNLLFVKVDPAIPIALRSQYQEYAEKIFNGQKFIPASENNGNKPDFSNLPVRVIIQSALD